MGNPLLIQVAPITLSLERFAQLLQENRILGYSTLCVSLYVFYWICLSIYHLTFHPLAKYPGPWLAAVSPVRTPINYPRLIFLTSFVAFLLLGFCSWKSWS
jgi:hypothetical protein